MAKHKKTGNQNQPKPGPAGGPKPAVTQQSNVGAPQKTPGKTMQWLIAILALLAFAVNAPTIGYDYTLDDPYFTKSNPLVAEGVSSIPAFFTHAAYYGVFKNHDASYRPLMLTSFAIEKQVFGFDPRVSHLINLLLFAALVTALFLLLRRVFKNYSIYIPFFIVLLFELHPIHTEVVASIKSRDELMAMLFTAICTLHSFLYADTGKAKYLYTSGLFFFCALMSKETPITFVGIMPMTLWFFREIPIKKIVVAAIPYGIVAAGYMLMRASFIESDGEKVRILVNNNALMAAANYGEKLGTALFIQLKYIVLLVVPHPLSYDYSFNQIPLIGLGNPKALAAVAVLAGLLVYALLNLKKKSVFSYCILFYYASVIITANLIVDIGATMAERFVFTASLGFCIALVFLVVKLMKADMVRLNFAGSKTVFYVLGAVALLYAGKTMARNEVWKNNLDLYEDGVITAPDSWRSQYLLGVEYTRMINEQKDPARKKEYFDKAIEHLGRSRDILPGNPDPYLIMGYAFEFAGRDDSAMRVYRSAITIDPANMKASMNLGAVMLRRDSLDGAIRIFSQIVAGDSTNNEAVTDLAAAYGNKGLFKESERYYLMAERMKPNQPPNVFQSMSNIYRFMGDSAKAQHYRELLRKSLNSNK